MPETRIAVDNHACAVCSQLDNHPMIHTDIPDWVDLEGRSHQFPSFHFDCLPPELEYRLGNDDTHPQHYNTRQAIKAAREGTHGEDLRHYIQELADQFNDNAYGELNPHTFRLGGNDDPEQSVDDETRRRADELQRAYQSVRGNE